MSTIIGRKCKTCGYYREHNAYGFYPCVRVDKRNIDKLLVAQNDGLSLEDWLSWFKNYDHTKPLAIIHFTNFRY